MSTNFKECPFYLNEIKINSIYRSLSPGNFFITFKEDDLISKPIIVATPYNPFCQYIASCDTVWHPDFESMKTLLILGVSVKELPTEEERRQLLESTDEIIIFGTYHFSEDCSYNLVDGKYSLGNRKPFQFVIDNKKEEIKIVHSKNA